ncbi:hypothetical protein SAY86_007559 [Trapa natans]|uniref:Two-component response regulator-like APRR7 n=1 Tax=Trapa natans TaxID=22666 RepID=A0AAN7R0G6_TRANT|nr:hypothetical protein SAY86_007559 [Trapa natans]
MTADDGDRDKDSLRPDGTLLDGKKRVKDSIARNEQQISKDNGLIYNENISDLQDGRSGPTWNQAMLQVQKQKPPRTANWERFLHLRSLKVLLVENDDSTRHVVSALLRNCSYEVIEAANVLHAWKILEDLTKHIDLVLAEVSMPSLYGIALLSKIMSHRTRKNIPVIMMSSHDSMGLVFKCLSRGAVDFLVKPIRKNELKNLWQHVWRRCHSSSGSGSESCTQTQKSVRSKSIERSGNFTSDNDEDDNGSTDLNIGDGSDSESGTHTCWTKQSAEIDSPQLTSSWDGAVGCADSTCAQVIHWNAETSQNKQVLAIGSKKSKELQELPGNIPVGSKIELCLSRNKGLQDVQPMDLLNKTKASEQRNLLEKASCNFSEGTDKGKLDIIFSEIPSNKMLNEPASLTGIGMNTDSQTETRELEGPRRISSVSDINNVQSNDTKDFPPIELSLKRQRSVKEIAAEDERKVLRRSDASAFSRYNFSSATSNNAPGNSVSGQMKKSNMKAKGKDLIQDNDGHSNGEVPEQCSKWGSNDIDMGSTTNGMVTPSLIRSKAFITTKMKCLDPSRLHTPENYHRKTGESAGAAAKGQVKGVQSILHLQDQHHHHEKQVLSHHHDLSMKLLAASAPHCGSSNLLGGHVEGNAANYSVNGSATGSNHGSNGVNRSSVAANDGGMNGESENGDAGKNGSGNAGMSGSGSGSGVADNTGEGNRFAQRVAALGKFRPKRSKRCFHKKVRYQSRRLAEQRPCIRGQFVRKSTDKNTSNCADS